MIDPNTQVLNRLEASAVDSVDGSLDAAVDNLERAINDLDTSRECFRDGDELEAALSLDDGREAAQDALLAVKWVRAMRVMNVGEDQDETDDEADDSSEESSEDDGDDGDDGDDEGDEESEESTERAKRSVFNTNFPSYPTKDDDSLPSFIAADGSTNRCHPGSRNHQLLYLLHYYLYRKEVEAGNAPESTDDLGTVTPKVIYQTFDDLLHSNSVADSGMANLFKFGLADRPERGEYKPSESGIEFLREYGRPKPDEAEYPVPDEYAEVQAGNGDGGGVEEVDLESSQASSAE